MQKITESTLFPFSILGSIIAIAYWMIGIENIAKSAYKSAEKLETEFRSSESLREKRDREIIERLSRIETIVKKGE